MGGSAFSTNLLITPQEHQTAAVPARAHALFTVLDSPLLTMVAASLGPSNITLSRFTSLADLAPGPTAPWACRW